jgi:hypothetical protein
MCVNALTLTPLARVVLQDSTQDWRIEYAMVALHKSLGHSNSTSTCKRALHMCCCSAYTGCECDTDSIVRCIVRL